MDLQDIPHLKIISLKPTTIFAFLKILPLIFISLGFLFMAWWIFPGLIWLSLIMMVLASYRFMYIRHIRYILTSEVLRISRGIFYKRTDSVELYRIKDYVLTQPLILQIFRLMDLTLKTTDPENPIIWLRGLPLSDLTDVIRDLVQHARQHNKIYEIN